MAAIQAGQLMLIAAVDCSRCAETSEEQFRLTIDDRRDNI